MAPAIKRPMTIMFVSGSTDHIHMGLMTAATASAMGRPVTLFFSKSAVKAVLEGGWPALCDADGKDAGALGESQEAQGIASFEMLMEALGALSARFIACETAIAEQGDALTPFLRSPIIETGGLATLIEEGTGGDWLTF